MELSEVLTGTKRGATVLGEEGQAILSVAIAVTLGWGAWECLKENGDAGAGAMKFLLGVLGVMFVAGSC
jgi:hypothetical protein